MSARAGRVERALFAVLLRAYPDEFRAEFTRELADTFALMHGAACDGGVRERLVFWLRLLADTLRAAPVEWWRVRRERAAASAAAAAARGVPAPDYGGALIAAAGVLLLYWITLAPTTAFWDAGEYITVAHIAGIPHPPGNPLFVMLARAWDVLLSPAGWPVAVRINVLSAVCSALAHLFLFLTIDRALQGGGADRMARRVSAGCAVLLSATAFTVWNQSNVNEKVYTISFATTLAVMWLALRWRDTRDVKLLVLAVYVTALTAANHLMGVLVAPAALLFVVRVDRRVLGQRRVWAAALPAVLLAASMHFVLPIRAAQSPLVNESDPACASLGSAAVSIYSNGAGGCAALSETLRRVQYRKPGILTDPTQPERRRSMDLTTSQFVNYLQYVDWQWARSVAGADPLFGGARPFITLFVLLLCAAGARVHWRSDRSGALLHGVLLLTLSVGLVLYLNFKYGYAIRTAEFPDRELHEVRERDYFFLISFSLIGAWLGLGLAALWQLTAQRLAQFPRARLLATPVLVLALLPLALNWSWAGRSDDWTARDWAYNVLMSVEPYGVLVTNGDNDSFPLWYLQHVERIREDVTIVLSPYLGTTWYARQLRDISRPCAEGEDPAADPSRIICQRPFRPEQVHPRLLAAWGGATREPPKDSILPLSDSELAGISEGFFVAEAPLQFRAGSITGTIAAGTFITPIDTFVAAIVQNTFGERPIHFMSPSSPAANLGLLEHTVRVGLTWKLKDSARSGQLIAMPAGAPRANVGAYVDLVTTDTLTRDVFIHRGRITDPDAPWVDHAAGSIPMQYVMMHYGAAIAHELRGDAAGVQRHVRQMEEWNAVIGD